MESIPLVVSLLGMLFVGSLFAVDKQRDLAIFYFFCICFFVLLIIRTRGWDFELYAAMFESVAVDSISSSWTEPGFLVAMLVVKSIGGNFFIFNMLYALLFVVLFSKVCKWIGFGLCFAALLYFCFYYFRGPYGQLRQSISVLIFIFTLRHLYARPSVYFAINSAAALFHGLSLIAFPFYVVSRLMKWDMRIAWLLLIAAGVFTRLVILPHMTDASYDVSILNKFKYYLSLADEKNVLYRSIELPKIIFVTVVLFLFYPKYSEISLLEKTLIMCYFFGIYLFLVLSIDLRLASRLAAPFLTVDFLILANALRYSRGFPRIFLILLSGSLGLFYLLNEILMMSNATLEYSW